LEALPGVERARVLGIALAVRPGETHLARAHETGEIVDVSAGLVVEYAPAQPDDVTHAEVLAQQPLDVGALEARIAVGVEEALLGDERRAFPVDVHGAAFVHHWRAIALEDRKSTRLNSSHGS